jgi:hypothetical protein
LITHSKQDEVSTEEREQVSSHPVDAFNPILTKGYHSPTQGQALVAVNRSSYNLIGFVERSRTSSDTAHVLYNADFLSSEGVYVK